MKKKISIFALAALVLAGASAQRGAAQAGKKPTLAVFVVGMENNPAADYFASLVGSELARAGKYEVALRSEAVQRKLAELRAYEGEGHVDDRELVAWGRQSSVAVLCIVHVVHLGEYLFSAQLTDVATTRLLGSGSYVIPEARGDDLKKAAAAIAAQLQQKKQP